VPQADALRHLRLLDTRDRAILFATLALGLLLLAVIVSRMANQARELPGVPQAVSMPVVTGKSVGDAESELRKRGLALTEVRQQTSAGTRAGTVIAQEPAGSVRMRQGESVIVTIAVPPVPPKP